MTELDIATKMAGLLDPNSVKQAANTTAIKEALQSLAQAADIMDNMNMHIGAEAVTQLMEKVASNLKE